jgi:hypothetical protein
MESRMRQSLRLAIFLAIASIALTAIIHDGSRAAESNPLLREVQNTEEYFPDGIGSVWEYVGQTHTETIERIANTAFHNKVTTIGTSNMRGVMVKIFRETNQGNKGPTDGFFRRDKTGIVYYGSQPTTPFEQQLVPYRVLDFPLMLGATFQQLNKTDVDMQVDLDGDGHPERGSVAADARVVGYESVTVPAGTFHDALRIDAIMTISVTLTKQRNVAVSQDKIMSWFVRGIGLVKYIETIEAPAVHATRGEITYLSEELESYTIKGLVKSFLTPTPFRHLVGL